MLIQRNYNKIFAIGGHKNGSLSLHHYFQSMGLRSVHGQFWRTKPELIAENDCFSDHFAEFQDDVSELDQLVKRYPDSRFIINFRDLTGYVNSLFKHLAINTETGEPFNFDEVDETAVIGRIEKTHRFHQLALAYFSERKMLDDVLVINLCNGENEKNKRLIDGFLGMSGFSEQLPHANHFSHISSGKQREYAERHAQKLQYIQDNLSISAAQYSETLNACYLNQ